MPADALDQRCGQPGLVQPRVFPQRAAVRSQGTPVIGLQMGGKAVLQSTAVRRSDGAVMAADTVDGARNALEELLFESGGMNET